MDCSAILKNMKDSRIAIIGDFCLDFYIFLDQSRSEISIETNLPTSCVRSYSIAPGGAGNVAKNSKSIGASVKVFGILGDDAFGHELMNQFNALGIDCSGLLIQSENWMTPVYSKMMDDTSELPRIDFGNFNMVSNAKIEDLLSSFISLIHNVDVVIINEQLKNGIHCDTLRNGIANTLKRYPEKKFIIDSRYHSDFYDGCIRKLNLKEATDILGRTSDVASDEKSVLSIGADLYTRWREPFIVTRGERGLLLWDHEGPFFVPGIHYGGPVDPVGAGDALVAGIAACLGTKASLRDSVTFANYVAAVTVRKRFTTGTANPDEIEKICDENDLSYNVDLAYNPSQASIDDISGFEVITNNCIPRDLPCHVIFDNDGTLSTLRSGWEPVMESVMVQAIVGTDSVKSSIVETARAQVKSLIEGTTGVRTLEQMRELIKLIKDFRIIHEHTILSPLEYKKIYLQQLERLIASRKSGIKKGLYVPEDFLIKGSIQFLSFLFDKKVFLHLASGTDEESVIEESRLLGIDHFFESRIHGANDEIREDPKRQIIRSILSSSKEGPSSLAVFGDGPVEIREAHKIGTFAVGVMSDEARRIGFNPSKRKRLVMAGADIIIPDFSDIKSIIRVCGWTGTR